MSFANMAFPIVELEEKRMELEGMASRPITVGLVYCLDEIRRHGSKHAASNICKALREAASDPTVDAIVVRVNSPGGDVVASDTMLGLIRRIQATTKKPVIASFAGVVRCTCSFLPYWNYKILTLTLTQCRVPAVAIIYLPLRMPLWPILPQSQDRLGLLL
jgi:hypothetical protein